MSHPSPASALYAGAVTHVRTRPRVHKLRYRVFWTLLDLDEIDGLDKRLKLFARNRFSLLSFFDRDHGAGTAEPLRTQVERYLAQAGIILDGGPIRLLSMPRVLGYVFNPISVYFCHRPGGELAAMIYEVTNTFHQRHSYLIPVEAGLPKGAAVMQSCQKDLYVSPFIGMDIRYDFRLTEPNERVSLVVRGSDPQGLLISAAMYGKRAEFSDGAILRTVLRHPLLTLKVVGAIHWEALKLWGKGVRLVRRPPPPDAPVTIVDTRAG